MRGSWFKGEEGVTVQRLGEGHGLGVWRGLRCRGRSRVMVYGLRRGHCLDARRVLSSPLFSGEERVTVPRRGRIKVKCSTVKCERSTAVEFYEFCFLPGKTWHGRFCPHK